MKKTKRARTAKSRTKAHGVAAGRPARPTRKRLKHIAEDVMTQERRDRRALDRQAELPRGRRESPTRRRSAPQGEAVIAPRAMP
jgi:hypothetical protein